MSGEDGLEDALTALCDEPAVEFAVRFGSRTNGDPRPSSDLDVAVQFSDSAGDGERFQTLCRLSAAVQRSNAPYVDLSDLDELPLEIAYDAVQGRLLCGDRDRFRAVKRTVESRYEERRDEIDRRHRDRIRRIADEGLHG